jgi:Spy/CpxP family protein refolding chaperone
MKKGFGMLALAAMLIAASVASQPGPGPDSGGAGMGRGGRMMRGGAPMMHNRMGMQGGPRMEMMEKMAEKLELTDAQKAQFDKMRTDFQLVMVDKQADLRKAQIKLRASMRDDKVAEADVLKGIDEVSRLRTDMAKARFSHMRQMRGLLTDKQRDMLKGMRRGGMGMFGMDMPGEDEDDDQPCQFEAPEPGADS